MRFSQFLRIAILFFPLMAAPPAYAAEGDEFQLIVENDVWANTDRYYTNGFKLGLGRSLDALRKPMQGLLQEFAPLLVQPMEHAAEFGLFLGQNLYTPRNIGIAAPQAADRPWAAWLYLGGVAQLVREEKRLDTVEIDLGVVGPAAGGRWVQGEWHRLIGSPAPQGWGNQQPNEPAILVSYLQKRRYGSATLDIVPRAGITAGTVMTLARAGAMLRLGQNMSGFGADTIEPGGVILQNTHRKEHRSEWYAFVDVDHRLVAHNVFLDGSLFHDSASVTRRAHVYDLKVGLAARFGVARLSLARIRRSEEFHTPYGGGGSQYFHSINLGIEF